MSRSQVQFRSIFPLSVTALSASWGLSSLPGPVAQGTCSFLWRRCGPRRDKKHLPASCCLLEGTDVTVAHRPPDHRFIHTADAPLCKCSLAMRDSSRCYTVWSRGMPYLYSALGRCHSTRPEMVPETSQGNHEPFPVKYLRAHCSPADNCWDDCWADQWDEEAQKMSATAA